MLQHSHIYKAAGATSKKNISFDADFFEDAIYECVNDVNFSTNYVTES